MVSSDDVLKISLLILNKINKIKELPKLKNAVIAGGAVCNLIHNYFNKKNSPVNDIDIFVFHEKESNNKDYNLDGAFINYNFLIKTDKNEQYKILSTNRDGYINYIHVEVENKENIEDLTKTLLKNFDINSTKGAIILETSKLIILDEFIDFLNNQQLEATSIKTPIKTILRLLKKQNELDVFLNKSHIESIYQFARFRETVIIQENFEKFKKEIILIKDKILPIKLRNGNVKLKYLQKFEPLHKNELKIIKNQGGNVLIRILEQKFNNSNKIKKYNKIIPYWRVLNNVVFNNFEEKTKDGFNSNDLVNFEKLLNKVPELTDSFSKLSLRDSIFICNKIRSFNLNDSFFNQFLGFLSKKELSLSKISEDYNQFQKEYLLKSKSIVKKLDIESKFVYELISKNHLELEGSEMNHCVGGYFNKINENNRIFSIKKGKLRSTIEIKKDNGVWIGVQHFGKNNTFPNNELRDIAILFIKKLNQTL